MLWRRRRMLFDDMLRLQLCAPCICLLVPNPRHRAVPRSQNTPQLTADIALMASITFFAATIGHSAPNTRRGLAQRQPNTPPDDADIIAAPAADPPAGVRALPLAPRARRAAQLREVACIHNREDVLGGRLRVGPARLGAVLSAGVARPAVFSQDGGEGSGKAASGLSGDRSRGDRQGRRRAHSRRRGRGVRPMGSHTGTVLLRRPAHALPPQWPRRAARRFQLSRPWCSFSCLRQTQSDDALNLNDSTPFEHAPHPTSDTFEHQSGGAFVPGGARGSRRMVIRTMDSSSPPL
ncbi:hypothetical protein C8J57DRAFT_1481294, partial [Mycena rebaudengoi]